MQSTFSSGPLETSSYAKHHGDVSETQLSLATFDPSATSAHPYLNTPRSLESCRLHGVQPIELIEIPLDEFRKDFPNDPDAARRRYERIDGARRRLLASVICSWKYLCDSRWTSDQNKITDFHRERESIIHVPPVAHSTVLEIQAENFRKAEISQWKTLQTTLSREVKKALDEVRNREIASKHDATQSSNDRHKRMIIERRQQAAIDAVEVARRREMEREQELKMIQEQEYQFARRKALEDEMQARRERQVREERELTRVQREEFSRQRRLAQEEALASMTEENRRAQEARDVIMAERGRAESAERERAMGQRQDQHLDRMRRARDDVATSEAKKKSEFLKREGDDRERRRLQLEEQEQRRREQRARSEERMSQLRERIRQATVEGDAEKSRRLQCELDHKEALAQQELSKVKEAQNRRRNIKAIRQEAFDLSATRHRKAEEHRLALVQETIQRKESRSAAIKEGRATLARMRSQLSTAMLSTTFDLKDELERQQASSHFSASQALETMVRVSETVLMPRLQQRFGTVHRVATAPPASSSPSSRLAHTSAPTSASRRDGSWPAAEHSPLKSSPGSRSRSRSGSPLRPRSGSRPASNSSRNRSHSRSHRDDDVDIDADAREQLNMAEAGGGTGRPGSGTGTGTGTGAKGSKSTYELALLAPSAEAIRASLHKAQVAFNSGGTSTSLFTSLHRSRGTPGGSRVFSSRRDGDDGGADDSDKMYRLLAEEVEAEGGAGRGTGEEKRVLKTSGDDDDGGEDRGLLAPSSIDLDDYEAEAEADADGRRRTPTTAADGRGPTTRSFDLAPRDVSVSGSVSRIDSVASGGRGRSGEASGLSTLPALSAGSSSSSRGGPGLLHASQQQSSPGGLSSGSRPPKQGQGQGQGSSSGEFRREFSSDHPLAGGAGRYQRERARGLRPVGGEYTVAATTTAQGQSQGQGLGIGPGPGHSEVERHLAGEKLSLLTRHRGLDPGRRLEQLRRQQNAALLRVLEEERVAEEDRVRASRATLTGAALTDQERSRLELVFAEERRRASERIVSLTRQHEDSIKAAVLALMHMGEGNNNGNDSSPKMTATRIR